MTNRGVDAPSAPRRARRIIASSVIVAGVALGAVGLGTVDVGAAEPATAPVTEPPSTTPVTVTTPGTVPGGGGDDSSDTPWPLIIAIIAVGGVVIALLATATRRRSPAPSASGSVPPRADIADQDRGYALGAAQWVHDHFSLELLAAEPAQAAQRWNADRGRIDDAAIRAQQFSAQPDGLTWQRLGQCLSLLSTSLDSYIRLRNQAQPDQQAIAEARAVVNKHRADLGLQLAQLWPTVEH